MRCVPKAAPSLLHGAGYGRAKPRGFRSAVGRLTPSITLHPLLPPQAPPWALEALGCLLSTRLEKVETEAHGHWVLCCGPPISPLRLGGHPPSPRKSDAAPESRLGYSRKPLRVNHRDTDQKRFVIFGPRRDCPAPRTPGRQENAMVGASFARRGAERR